MKQVSKEIYIGIFVCIGSIALLCLALFIGAGNSISTGTYAVSAQFSNIHGIKKGAQVTIAGVPIGRVTALTLSKDSTTAKMTLRINNAVAIPEDSIAVIKTNGIIGDKYVRILVGSSKNMLKNDMEIADTQPPVDLEELLGKYVFGTTS